jgi:hypothetical protein
MRLLCSLVGFASLVLLATGCSSPPTQQDHTGAPNVDSPRAEAPSCSQATEASSLDDAVGEWPPSELHLAGIADAVDLTLAKDGTFRLTLFGCDYSRCAAGTWRSESGAVVLGAAEGNANFYWPTTAGQVTSVVLIRDSLTAVQAQIAGPNAESQAWAFGLVCAACCGGLGPSGLYSCDRALPDMCPT